jgi:hypothetical protein
LNSRRAFLYNWARLKSLLARGRMLFIEGAPRVVEAVL